MVQANSESLRMKEQTHMLQEAIIGLMNFFNLESTSELSDTIKIVVKFANLHNSFAKKVLREKKAKEVERLDAKKSILLSHQTSLNQ